MGFPITPCTALTLVDRLSALRFSFYSNLSLAASGLVCEIDKTNQLTELVTGAIIGGTVRPHSKGPSARTPIDAYLIPFISNKYRRVTIFN